MKVSDLDGEAPESTDYANYFCTYSYLYHQKDMLEDHKRTGAYYQAIMSNKRQFHNKVVLDVGTGSGILAIFAAKAGAKKVYAVEATSMALNARKLVAHNKLDHIVEVIQGTVETIKLPEKVDIIVSEWMGYFLLRESMLDSVLIARDKFLKEGGALYPSHANMYISPIATKITGNKAADLESSLDGWQGFTEDMSKYYQVDLSCFDQAFDEEQKEFFLGTSQWTDIHPSQVLGTASCFKRYDLHTVTLDELKGVLKAPFSMQVVTRGPVDALCGYFDVTFSGSAANPTDNNVILTTMPDQTGATHWGQQTFVMYPTLECAPGDTIKGDIVVTRRNDNQRLLKVEADVVVEGNSAFARNSKPRKFIYNID